MGRTRAGVFAALVFLSQGCASGYVARRTGVAGWYVVEDGKTRPLELSGPCRELRQWKQENDTRTVVVAVHGIKGDGTEWTAPYASLEAATRGIGHVLLFRWVPWDERDGIASRLAAGLSHLLACAPETAGHIVVLAHSAGGVLASFAANKVVAPASPDGPSLFVATVASPLAGTVGRNGNSDGSQEARFMLDLGSRISGYPPSATGVSVAHLRTAWPADTVMRPQPGITPNDRAVGVPNGRQVDLPSELTHDGALTFVAERVAEGSWLSLYFPPRSEAPP